MPKKTKKHKIEARRHRLQKKDEVTPTYSEKIHSEESPSVVVAATPKPTQKKAIFQAQEENTMYFRHDLLKSLMITMIIVCAQVAIYVAQLSGIVDITNLISF